MKKAYVWIISLLVLFGLALGFWSISNRAYSAENALEAAYQRGFYNLIDQVNNLNLLISKSMVTSSDLQRIMTLTTLWHQAEAARDSLSQLPLGDRDMTYSQKFFAQLGDFSYSLAKKVVAKESITDAEWSKMEVFKKNIQILSRELRSLQDNVASGRIRWENRRFTVGKLKNLPQGMADSFVRIDQKLKEEAPTITYDGPFSDHVENIKPRGITGKPVKDTEAIEIAKRFIGSEKRGNYHINITGRTRGVLPAYNIEFTRAGSSSPEIVMDVSQTGGHVIWFLNTRDIGEKKLDIRQAVERARNFLMVRGFGDMEPTGSLKDDNTVTITFVPKMGEILLYPDFIKVEVALDNGQVVGFDAVSYLTFHTSRNLPQVKLTKQDVIKTLNRNLNVKRVRLALIPDPALREKLCYEVDARLKDERYLIYINAVNGEEEQILKVVETEEGTMTM